MKTKFVAPEYRSKTFHCPHCKVYAHQEWVIPEFYDENDEEYHRIQRLVLSYCVSCSKYSLWVNKELIYPLSSIAPFPVDDMPDDVKEDFMEARNIVYASPRATAALLRLALQKLMPYLGEKGQNINEDIGNLVKKGLPEKIQKALDSLRVIGNNAVHPGHIDLKDDVKTVIALFDI